MCQGDRSPFELIPIACVPRKDPVVICNRDVKEPEKGVDDADASPVEGNRDAAHNPTTRSKASCESITNERSLSHNFRTSKMRLG
jgi:hypothetical protein